MYQLLYRYNSYVDVSANTRYKLLNCVPSNEVGAIYAVNKGNHFNKETMDGFIQLGTILRKIHNRLLQEGYSIIDGRLIAPNGDVIYEPKKHTKQH